MSTNQSNAEGEARKQAAFDLHEAHREYWLRLARRALVRHALEHGTATADDVAASLGELPDGLDPRWLGAVPLPLARAGIIKRKTYVKSTRPSRHASPISFWRLKSIRKGRLWLAANPELPEPEGDAGPLCLASQSSPSSSEPAAAR